MAPQGYRGGAPPLTLPFLYSLASPPRPHASLHTAGGKRWLGTQGESPMILSALSSYEGGSTINRLSCNDHLQAGPADPGVGGGWV